MGEPDDAGRDLRRRKRCRVLGHQCLRDHARRMVLEIPGAVSPVAR
ncbi:hypothetical protein [Gordonia sp. C13]|nr:hypothetical protein [Gordonia sp. C13]MCK8612898.1 hypothetical protein [Gordonia sp. C13]